MRPAGGGRDRERFKRGSPRAVSRFRRTSDIVRCERGMPATTARPLSTSCSSYLGKPRRCRRMAWKRERIVQKRLAEIVDYIEAARKRLLAAAKGVNPSFAEIR